MSRFLSKKHVAGQKFLLGGPNLGRGPYVAHPWIKLYVATLMRRQSVFLLYYTASTSIYVHVDYCASCSFFLQKLIQNV